MSQRRITIALLLILIVSTASAQQKSAQPSLSEMMDALRTVADSYPPKIANDEERKKAEALFRRLETGLKEYIAERQKPDFNGHLLLGDVYRMGHNLGIAEAGKNAIIHLQKAIEIEPAQARPHDLLGRHYTFMNQPADGLPELLLAYALAKEDERETTLWSLTFNYYLQKNYPLALAFADRFEAKRPGVEAIELIRNTSRKAIDTGVAPRIIESEKP